MSQNLELNGSEVSDLKALLRLIKNGKSETLVTLEYAYDEYLSYAGSNLSAKSCLSIKTSFNHLKNYFG